MFPWHTRHAFKLLLLQVICELIAGLLLLKVTAIRVHEIALLLLFIEKHEFIVVSIVDGGGGGGGGCGVVVDVVI